MNKIAKIIISVISVVLVLVIGSVAVLIAENHVPQNDMKLFGDYYMYRNSNTNSILYQKIDDSQKHNLIQGWVFKFAFDKENQVIAMRYMVAYKLKDVSGEVPNVLYNRFYAGEEYAVVEDCIKVYDCKKDEFIDFENDAFLLNYCVNNDVELSNWYYPGGDGYYESSKTALDRKFGIYHETSVYGYSSIVNDEFETYYGFITDIEYRDDCLSFRLRRTKNSYSPEYIDANEGLSPLSEKPIGKYNGEDIYYDKRIYIAPEYFDESDP